MSPAIFEQREERLDVLDPLKGPGFDVAGPLGAQGGRACAGGHGDVGGRAKQAAGEIRIARENARNGDHAFLPATLNSYALKASPF